MEDLHGARSTGWGSVEEGVAEPRLAPAQRAAPQQKSRAIVENDNPGYHKVREGGVEPPRPHGHTDLNRARLPIPPLEQ